ncbi:MAG: amidohydrolase [Pseudomonadota bacterium]
MNTDELSITLIQSDIVWEDYQANINNFEKKIKQANETDLVILPEMFSTGFSMNPKPIAQTMDGPVVEWMRETAIKRNISIAGSIIIEDQGEYYNRFIWASADGSLHKYDKKHLFSFAGEDKHFSMGSEKLIVKIKNWKVATFICYDLRFPMWSRNIKEDYDLAIYIASWPEKRSEHWKVLLTARAIENQSYVVGLNRVGEDGNKISYSGDSMIVDPLGEMLFQEAYEETTYKHVLNKTKLNNIRQSFPFLKDADKFKMMA